MIRNCAVWFSRDMRGMKNIRAREEFWRTQRETKSFLFLRRLIFLHCEELKKGGKARHGGDDPNGGVRDVDREH